MRNPVRCFRWHRAVITRRAPLLGALGDILAGLSAESAARRPGFLPRSVHDVTDFLSDLADRFSKILALLHGVGDNLLVYGSAEVERLYALLETLVDQIIGELDGVCFHLILILRFDEETGIPKSR